MDGWIGWRAECGGGEYLLHLPGCVLLGGDDMICNVLKSKSKTDSIINIARIKVPSFLRSRLFTYLLFILSFRRCIGVIAIVVKREGIFIIQ